MFFTRPPPPSKQPSPPIASAPSSEWQERGAKMLLGMGWREGMGLGRYSQGIVAPIDTRATAFRPDTMRPGVGLECERLPKSALAHKHEGVKTPTSASNASVNTTNKAGQKLQQQRLREQYVAGWMQHHSDLASAHLKQVVSLPREFVSLDSPASANAAFGLFTPLQHTHRTISSSSH